MDEPQKEIILEEILSRRVYDPVSLPDIGKPKSLMDYFLEIDFVKSIVEFINNLSPSANVKNISLSINLEHFYNFLSFIFIALIVITAIVPIMLLINYSYTKIQKLDSSIDKNHESIANKNLDESTELNELIKNGDYQKALRLKWIQFIVKFKTKTSVTPIDFLKQKNKDPDYEILKSNLFLFYLIMFSGKSFSKIDFEKCLVILGEIESKVEVE